MTQTIQDIKLFPQQQEAINSISNFLNGNDQVFILKGCAGTGKTTLVKVLLNIVAKLQWSVKLLSPTGRAAKILSEKSGYDASTIHREIYSIFKDKEDVNDFVQFNIHTNEDSCQTLYIVDEASMVADINGDNESLRFGSGRLLCDLMTYVNIKNSQRKILFIGDYAQLPPVGQQLSPALSEEYLKAEYNVSVQSFVLTEVIRQSLDSGIYANAKAIRDSIDLKRYNQFTITPSADVTPFSLETFIDLYRQKVNELGEDGCIILTSSNAQALEYNKIVRKDKFGEANTHQVRRGDKLLITQNNYSQGCVLFNGTFVQVYSASENIETHRAYIGNESFDLRFRSVELLIDDVVKQYYILDDYLTMREGKLPQIMRDALWAEFDQRMSNLGYKRNTPEFNMLKKTDPYYNALHCKYGYAITCHKSQGGEWSTVFADMDVYMGRQCENFFRWAYTAITRAKSQLYHISSPDFNAINQIIIHPIQRCKAGGELFKVPENQERHDYLFSRIQQLAQSKGINCSESRSIAWQHRIIFTEGNQSCTLSLWEDSKFYTGKMNCLQTYSNDFMLKCRGIVKQSLTPEEITFNPTFEFQGQLHQHLLDVVNEEGLILTNVVQGQWFDLYYIATDADTAYIKFFYNGRHTYTSAQPYSTLGEDDEQIRNLIEKI